MLKLDNQSKVLEEFLKLKSEEDGLRLRELGRKIGLAPTSVKKYLEELEGEGIIKKRVEKGETYPIYTINSGNEHLKHLSAMRIIKKINEIGLIKQLERDYFSELIVLEGVNLYGGEPVKERITFYIKTKEKKEEKSMKLYEEELKKKIKIVTYQKIGELSKEEKKELINGIVIKGKIDLEEGELPLISQIGEIEVPEPSEKTSFYSRILKNIPGI